MESVESKQTDVRSVMKAFWSEHSAGTLESMMLDTDAETIDKDERPEVLSLLPELAGKDVVELGAGMGRFTGALASRARSVAAVDFMDSLIKKNEELHGKLHKNVTFHCADATTFELTPRSVDMVFSNWLLMYLTDSEVRTVALSWLRFLRPGGHVFFRESCFRQSGNKPRSSNPTYYRHPDFYEEVFGSVRHEGWRLTLVRSARVDAYVRLKANQGQITWLWHKVPVAGAEEAAEATDAAEEEVGAEVMA